MEQRIEYFVGDIDKPHAITQGWSKSEELYKEGWFVHDTCHHLEVLPDGNTLTAMMITYRRNS